MKNKLGPDRELKTLLKKLKRARFTLKNKTNGVMIVPPDNGEPYMLRAGKGQRAFHPLRRYLKSYSHLL